MNSARFTDHPLYKSDRALTIVTEALLASGHTVFQIFQWPGGEARHSDQLLTMADPKEEARTVLSLGCGVGGMEAYWKASRPELEFELVNIAKPQLDRCVCDGRCVLDNAETYQSPWGPFDLVLVCYLLGHVDPLMTLCSALVNTDAGGTLLVYDVFDGSEQFCETWFYNTPTLRELERFGVDNNLRFQTVYEGGIPFGDYFAESGLWTAVDATPALFVFKKP